MESLEAQTNNLKATFQDFASNVINKEMISNVLNLANAFLEFMNTPFGQAATRITLLTTALTGLGGVLKGYMAFMKAGVFGKLFTKLNTGFGILTSAIGGSQMAITQLMGSLSAFGSTAAIIGLVVAAIAGFKKMYDATFPTVENVNNAISEDNQQLETNKKRLEEINELPWNERTQEILDEKAALEEENAELEKNIELNEKRKLTAAKTALFGSAANVKGGTFLGGYQASGGDIGVSKENLATMQEYIDALEKEGQLTAQQNSDLQEILPKMAERKAYYDVLVENYDNLTAEEKKQVDALKAEMDAYTLLVQKYDQSVYGQDALIESYKQLATTGYMTEEQYKKLISIYPQLANSATQTTNGYIMQKDALYNLMSAESQEVALIGSLVGGLVKEQQEAGNTGKSLYDLVAAQIRVSNTGMDLRQQITALKQLGYQAGLTAQQVNAALGVLGNYQDQRNIENTIKGYMYQGMTRAEAEAKVYGQMQSGLWTGISNVNASAFTPASYPAEDADDARQPQIKALQKEKDAVQDAIDAINDKYDDEVKAIEKEKDTIQDTIDEIKEAYNDQIDALEQEQDAVQETIDAINAKYDAQLDALEKYNDELEDEIELQQILEDMAKAKSTKKMVYKDGRFQYVEDLDAVAAAQTRLDEYNRKQALKKQKADIEEQRQLELKAYEDKKALLEQEQAIIEKRYELEIKSYESNKKLLEKEKENIETRRENELASYNERKNLLEQQIKSLQDYGDTYVDTVNSIGNNINDAVQNQNEQLKKKIEELQSLLDDYNNTNKSKTPLTDKAKEEASTLTPEQRAVYDQWKSRGVGHDVAMKEAEKWSSSKPPLTKPSSAKSPQQRLAGGTMSAHGGLTLVGENGPELRVLNQGDGILPSNITRNLWAMATNPVLRLGHSANIKNTAISVANITLPNVRNAEEFVSGLKNMAYQRAYARA